MDNIRISVSDFSKTPGPRYIIEGPFSGELFRDTVFRPAFIKAQESGARVIVDLDGTIGYGTSFLEETFGGMAREFGIDKVLERIEIISIEEEYLKDDIAGYIRDANKNYNPRVS